MTTNSAAIARSAWTVLRSPRRSRVADETVRRAEAAHKRAEHHREKCSRRVAEFATLDEEITAAT
jgi:hypothetical protein